MAINNEGVYTRNFYTKSENSEDEKGITVINPTKDKYGNAKYIDQEDLIMYANLMAEQTPRNRVIENKETKVVNIANNRSVNFLNPNSDSGGSLEKKEKLTTDWAKMFYDDEPYDSESFGMEEITIKNNASMVPQVDITFVDVRGKNLWERANDPNNPYNLFLTFPYPLFYLTVKGYLGEGMSMPLVLKRVNTTFSGQDGSFRTTAEFQSWTFAMLNDVLMQYAVLVPYMYELPNNEKYGYEGKKQLSEIFERQENSDNYSEPEQKINVGNSPITIPDLINNIGDVMLEISNKQIASDVVQRKNTLKKVQSELQRMNDTIINRYNLLSNAEVDADGDYKRLVTKDDNQAVDYTYLSSIVESFNKNIREISQTDYNNIKTKLGNAGSNLIDNDIFKAEIPENDGSIVTINKFSELMSNIFNDVIVDLNNDINRKFANKATNEVSETLNFEPNIENILRIVCNNLQAFLELLANKSGKAYTQALEDTLRQAQQIGNGDQNTKTGHIYPWPEYWVNQGDEGTQKDYPGKFFKNWEEVKFIDELIRARQRLDAVLNVDKGKDEVRTKRNLNALPIDHPLENRPYQSFQEKDLIKEVFKRASYSVFHEGYLYYGGNDTINTIATNKGRLEAQNLIAVANEKGDSANRLSNLDKLLKMIKSESDKTSLQKLRDYIIGDESLENIQGAINNFESNRLSELLEKSNFHNELKQDILISNPALIFVTYSSERDIYKSLKEHNYSITPNASQYLDEMENSFIYSNENNIILGLLNIKQYVENTVFKDVGNDLLSGISSHYNNWNQPMKENYRPVTNSNSNLNIKEEIFKNTYDESLSDESIYNKELNIEQNRYDNTE